MVILRIGRKLDMLGEAFFLEQFLSLIIESSWSCSKDKLKEAYSNKLSKTKNFECKMYTAIIDSFCKYSGIILQNQQEDIKDFVFATVETYINNSRIKKDRTPYTLLCALNAFDSKFGCNQFAGIVKDNEKIDLFTGFLQEYIVKNEELRKEYNLKKIDHIDESVGELYNKQKNADVIAEKRHEAVMTVLADIKLSTNTSGDYSKKEDASTNKSIFRNDSKEKYIKRWKSRLFLHRRKGDKNLTLENTYIHPLCKKIYPEEQKETLDNLETQLQEFFANGKSLLLIGPPGIGKTSVVCYLANKYREDQNVFVLRFSDWEREDWDELVDKKYHSILAAAICKKINCKQKDLENKVIILDGFDEIKYGDDSNKLLAKFTIFLRGIKGTKLIVTSRENYIEIENIKFEKVIKLCQFNEEKAAIFANTLLDKNTFKESDFNTDDLEVYGIPVILYMAITAQIDITKNDNKYNIYERIFALDGGIFDRFSTESELGYTQTVHIVSIEKKTFYNILCKTAFAMFKRDNISILYKEYLKIVSSECEDVLQSSLVWFDFPIDNLYEKGNTIEFVHKSIYEYFAAEYIFHEILKVYNNYILSHNINQTAEELSNLLCYNEISSEIQNFINYKFLNYFSEHKVLQARYKIFSEEMLYKILSVGPTYFLKNNLDNLFSQNSNLKIIIDLENMLFSNLMHMIHLGKKTTDKLVLQDSTIELIIRYIHINQLKTGIDLSYMDLGASLNQSMGLNYLSVINLSLKGAILHEVKFEHSKFERGSFVSATIRDTTIMDCDFVCTGFRSSVFNRVNAVNCVIAKAVFIGVQFDNVSFSNTAFFNSVFEDGAKFNQLEFKRSAFVNVELNDDFKNVNFQETTFDHAKMSGSFAGANFQYAKFINGTILTGGIFTNADFRGADLSGAVYTVELNDAILE